MRAFCELCGHIAVNNADCLRYRHPDRNELGLIGAARDYSPQFNKLSFLGVFRRRRQETSALRRGVFSPRIISRTIHRCDIAGGRQRVLDLLSHKRMVS